MKVRPTVFSEELGSPFPVLQKIWWRRSQHGDHLGEVSPSRVPILLGVSSRKYVFVLEQVPCLIADVKSTQNRSTRLVRTKTPMFQISML